MKVRDIQLLYDYNSWANAQILAASAHVSHERFITPTSHCFGSLRGTLVHILDGECAWRMLCQHQTLAGFHALQEPDFPTFAVLKQRWEEEEPAMRAYLGQLTDEDMTRLVCYTPEEGVHRERVLWHCLIHLINHGTQHRSEAAAILTEYGCSPDSLDLTAFLNTQQA